MLKLMKKEIELSMHPAALLMLALSTMVLIPNYPYLVVNFYTTLGIFFTCLLGRENNDIVYSLNLPIAKGDIVTARIGSSVLLQLVQMLITIPFAILSQKLNACNEAGIDANITYFAMAFVVYGIFNLIFFTGYYNNVTKIGVHFIIASTVSFLMVIVDIILTHANPWFRDCLDTKDPKYLSDKLMVLAIGVLVYILFTWLACRISKRRFIRNDN